METRKMELELNQIYLKCKAMFESLGYDTSTITTVKINGRLSSTLGRCREFRNRYTGEVKHEIEMSKKHLEYNLEHNLYKEVEHTMLHEIGHAVALHSAGHGPKWQAVMDKINRKYGFDIQTRHHSSEATQFVQAEKMAKVVTGEIKCENCGKVHTVKVTSVHYKYPERYRCRCGGRLEKI